MKSDKTRRAPQPARLISLTEDDEVKYWTKKFGASKERLAQAVRRVGQWPRAVEADLKRIG